MEIWQRICRSWRVPDNTESGTELKKVERAAALHWLRSTQNALKKSVGVGLSFFVISDDTPEHARALGGKCPVLTVSVDQCSVGQSAAWFMMYVLQISMIMLPDPSHGNHNDLQGALRSCSANLWATVLRTTLAFNALHGPWHGGAVWGRLCEAKDEYPRAKAHPTT